MTIAEPRMDRMIASVDHVFSWFLSGDWEKHHLDPGIAKDAAERLRRVDLDALHD